MKKILLFMSIIPVLSFPSLKQKTDIYIEPSYKIVGKKPILNFGVDVDLYSDSNGYFGSFNVKKEKLRLDDFNLNYSQKTNLKIMGGYQFLKDKMISPYFKISTYFGNGYSEKYDNYDYRDISTIVGMKLKKDSHKYDVSLEYNGNLLLFPEFLNLKNEYSYITERFETKNYFSIKNMFGEFITPGYSNYYKDSFLYDYTGNEKKFGIETRLITQNKIKIQEGLDIRLENNLRTISRDDILNNKLKEHTMFDNEFIFGVDYINKYITVETNIKENILLFYNNENGKYELDKYSSPKEKDKNDELKSKKFMEFPKDMKEDAKLVFNRFTVNNLITSKFELKNGKIEIIPRLFNEYELKSISDVTNNKSYLSHKINIQPEIGITLNVNKNLSFNNKTKVDFNINKTFDNKKNEIILKNKFTVSYNW